MKKFLLPLFALSLWISPYFAAALDAQENQQPLIADDVIITGTRLEQQNEKIPVQVTVITAADIKASGAQSIPDALKDLGGVIVTDLNGNGFNQKVDMGGFGETSDRHVAVVVNGRKMNPIDQTNINFLSIPIENVEKIEVLHGGNSVLYGGDAMGGVINIITKEPEEGSHVWGEAAGGSNDTLKGTAGVSFTNDDFDLSAGLVYYETDGYRDRSAADRRSAYAKFTYFATDTLYFNLEANSTQADYEYPGGLTLAAMESNRRQAANPQDEGESRDDYIVFSANSDWGLYGALNLNLSLRKYERQDTMVSWNAPAWSSYGYYDYEYSTIGFNPQYVLEQPLFGKDNRLTLGIEVYGTDYDSWNGDTTAKISINTYDHEQTTTGFYAQEEFSILEDLVLNIGGRYEDFDTTLKSSLGTDKDINENEWAWNFGLAYAFSAGSKIYTRAYQAYRYPRVDEYMILTSGSVNEDLKHEKSKGYEAGIRFVGMENRLSTNLRFFTFDVDDEITWNNVTWQNENLDETRHQGGELDIKFQATELLSLFGGFGYTDAEFTAGTNDGKRIPLVPEFKSNLGFSLNFACGLTYKFQYNHLGERYAGGDNANTYEKLSSADTVDMYLTYQVNQFEIFLNATNIFNEKYYNGYNYGPGYGSYYPMPEAVYYGGVRFRF